ncbi:MAG: DUF308 domain-containing protein [Proteobacteria bacterium]|nr:DUF308 domain-containing protein [Pseudomonadota bacterium]
MMSGRWLLWAGASVLALGAVGAALTLALSVTDVRWYSALIIVAGIALLAEAIAAPASDDRTPARGTRLVLGLLYIAAGLIALIQPAGAGLALTLVLGLLLIASGAVRMLWRLSKQGQHSRSLAVVLVLSSAALGFILIAEWPVSGLWALGLFVSADLDWVRRVLVLGGRQRQRAMNERSLSILSHTSFELTWIREQGDAS